MAKILLFTGMCLWTLLSICQPIDHNFLTEKYDQLHDSPTQQKFKKIAPMPAGVVYIQRPGEGADKIRWHFRQMKELGFTNLKGIYPVSGWTTEQLQLMALEEGLIPWWYGEGGWGPITEALLGKLNIDRNLPIQQIRNHPAMKEYQTNVLRKRIERTIEYRKQHPKGQAPKSSSQAFDPSVGKRGLDLTDKGKELFVQWAKDTYKTIEAVNRAYNQQHANLAVKEGGAFKDWNDFSKRWLMYNHREYRVRRDIFRFKVDQAQENLRQRVQAFHAFDPDAPFRAGGELSLFRPQPWWNVDFNGIADVMKDGGSFYPSIHYSWHFDHVGDEIVKSTYLQASFMNDLFKGGWSAAWECTGGPQQFDGEKFGDPDKGFTVDAGTLTQFFLSHLAAGFKGFGIWCWSARTAGKEAGEYSLLDRNNEITDRAIAVGNIGKAMQKYRDELWVAHKEPLVGIFYSWNSDAIWSAMSDRGRDDFRDRPMQARVGLGWALVEENIPFEHVTADDIEQGLAARYPIIYMPAILALNKAIMEQLGEYVKQGGTLVIDMPSGWYDEYAQLFPTGNGSIIEEIFGTVIRDYQYAGRNRMYTWQGTALKGSIGILKPTRAEVISSFDQGLPAITQSTYGKGEAIMLGFEASRNYFNFQDQDLKSNWLKYLLGNKVSGYSCEGAYVYRLAAPEADHYFFINDGPAQQVILKTQYDYQNCQDAITGKSLIMGEPIDLDNFGGRWLRFEK